MIQDQVHLNGKRMSRRGVRVRMLDPDEHGEILVQAAKMVSPEAKVIELKKKEWRLGIKQFITAYTEPCDDPLAEGVKWIKADLATLDEKFGDLFGVKDCAILEDLYRDFHEVSQAEVEAIAGKALPVSAD